MRKSTESSRRRLVTGRNLGERSHSSGVTPVVGKQRGLSGDNGNGKIKRRADSVFRRPILCSSAKASRAALTFFTAVAMMVVAIGIMVGTCFMVLPPNSETRIVTMERSGYNITENSDGQPGNIVLGKRPPPADGKVENFYQPSELEAYIVENGRAMGYDRQIANDPLSVSLPSTSSTNPLSLFKSIQRWNSAPSYVDYGDSINTRDMPSGCELWINPNVTNSEIYNGLESFRTELEAYEFVMVDWTWDPPNRKGDSMLWGWTWNNDTPERTERKDLRDFFDEASNNKGICKSLEIHPEGLRGIFTSSSSLSRLPLDSNSNEGQSAFLEPFLPPLRHPDFCHTHYKLQEHREHKRIKKNPKNGKFQHLENNYFLDTGYIVHDFAAMCRNNIHKHSRTVFVDIGKPFGFRNAKAPKDPPPSLDLLNLYQRFGFVFDHIYGYGAAPWDPSFALKEIPDILKAAYHDFNAGVESDPNSYANPFKIISEAYTPDDFVVVVLNTNNAPDLSIPLAHQLLLEEFDRTSKPPFEHSLADLIDVFYFSHHFTMKEMAFPWRNSMRGASMQDSIEFFTSLREHGIAAHYWI